MPSWDFGFSPPSRRRLRSDSAVNAGRPWDAANCDFDFLEDQHRGTRGISFVATPMSCRLGPACPPGRTLPSFSCAPLPGLAPKGRSPTSHNGESGCLPPALLCLGSSSNIAPIRCPRELHDHVPGFSPVLSGWQGKNPLCHLGLAPVFLKEGADRSFACPAHSLATCELGSSQGNGGYSGAASQGRVISTNVLTAAGAKGTPKRGDCRDRRTGAAGIRGAGGGWDHRGATPDQCTPNILCGRAETWLASSRLDPLGRVTLAQDGAQFL